MKIPYTSTEIAAGEGSVEVLLRTRGYEWLRYGVEAFPTHKSRHEWTYLDLVRIDIWRFGPVAFYRLAMPREKP